MKRYVLVFIFMFFLFFKVNADELTNYSKSAIMVEPSTKSILYDFNSHERRAPASMTKIMTLLIIMEYVDSGKISLNDKVLISKNAAGMGGSQVFLQENMEIEVDQLIKSISIASGNDAAVAMAEYIAGTTDEFVNLMNSKVQELGLVDTNFVNVHGLDADNHYSSAYDMAMISIELLKHESILNYTSLYEDYLLKPDGTKTWLVNTNKLVRFYKDVDGLKTGYTKNAMYCLTATAKRNDIRLITVVMGADSSENRSIDTTALLNYGFNTYKINRIITKNDVVGSINVKKGIINKVNIVAIDDVNDLIKQNEKKDYTYQIDTDNLIAPINVGDIIGKLSIYDNSNNLIKEVELTVQEDVKKHNIISMFCYTLRKVINGN